MNVLLVGSGGREHAVAWKLKQSQALGALYIAPGNAGTLKLGQNVPIGDTDIEGLVNFAKDNAVDLCVVGPEDPLSLGLVDAMEAAGISAFGPSRSAAQLEADKAFAKQLMRSSSISTAEGRVFDRFSDAKAYIASRDEPVVIKATGLAKGKGVMVCNDPADGILAAEKIMCDRVFGDAGNQLIVEDKLLGEEASILAFVDGKSIYMLESAQDHKPIGEGDTGANTGGMGAYSPAPIVTEPLSDKITREVLVPVVDGMKRNETPYKGVLYAGLMMTSGGPRVLEFNCRFGDPEIQAILVRLKSDLLEVFQAVCQERLDEMTLDWDHRPGVCVVMASGGYPGDYETGKEIRGLDAAEGLEDVVVFHAGTKQVGDRVVTNGGRVLGVTALGETTQEARARAYEAVDRITFEGAYCRRDIASKAMT